MSPKGKSGTEFFYDGPDSEKQDAALHEPILAGDHSEALEVSKDVLRRAGWTEEEIVRLLGEQ